MALPEDEPEGASDPPPPAEPSPEEPAPEEPAPEEPAPEEPAPEEPAPEEPAPEEPAPEEPAPEEPAPEEPAPEEPAPEEPAPEEPAPEEPPPEEPPPGEPVLEPEGEEVQVADHRPSPTPSEKERAPHRESTMSDIPLTESSVLVQLREADQQARATMILINNMKRTIEAYQNKPVLTEEDTRILEEKQMELLAKLSEFEAITRKMQKLVGLSSISLVQVKPGEVVEVKLGEGLPEGVGDKSVQTREQDFYPQPEEMLPQLVVCGYANNIPRILICETGDKPKPKPKLKPACKNYAQNKRGPQIPQLPPLPAQCSCAQEQLRDKENTIQSLKQKMTALESEMQEARKKNCSLTAQLAHVNLQQCTCQDKPPLPSTSCVPECDINYNPQAICPINTPECTPCVVNIAQAQKHSLNAECLKGQLNIIELEVQKMRDDLLKAQEEQQNLDGQRDLLKCAAPRCLGNDALTACACSITRPV